MAGYRDAEVELKRIIDRHLPSFTLTNQIGVKVKGNKHNIIFNAEVICTTKNIVSGKSGNKKVWKNFSCRMDGFTKINHNQIRRGQREYPINFQLNRYTIHIPLFTIRYNFNKKLDELY